MPFCKASLSPAATSTPPVVPAVFWGITCLVAFLMSWLNCPQLKSGRRSKEIQVFSCRLILIEAVKIAVNSYILSVCVVN
jgi:hypothetical protein